ncbi:MAG: hypothetical protein LBM99_05995, partial [Bacillales bacterium]|nr:hypothetical protein [Bacillales bacterium]
DWTKNEIYNTGDTLSPDKTMYARERHYTTFAQSISRYIGTNAKAISGSSTTEANSILGGLTGRFTPLIGFRKTYNKSNKTYNFTFNNIVKYGTSKIELNINQNYTQEEIRLLNNSYNIIQNPQDSGSYMINMDIYEVAQVHCLMAMAGLNPTLEWLENTYEPSNVTLYNFKTTITLEDDQEYIDLANQDCDNEEYEENRYHYIRIKLPYDWITNNWLRDDLRNINIYIGANKLNYYAIKEYPNKLFALVAVPPNLFNKTMNFKVLIMGRNHIDFINETLFRNMIDTRQSRIWKKWGSEDPEVKYLNVLNVDDTVQYMIFRNSVYPESNDNINITFDNGSYLVINENYVRFYYDNNNYDEIYNGTSWNRESYEFQAELKVTAITGKNDTYFQMNCQCTSNQTKSQTNFASTTFRENGINYLRATNNNGLKINSASRLKNSKIETLLCADFKSYYKQQGFYMRIMGNNLLDDYSINDNTDNTALFTCNEFENNQNRNRLFKYVDGAKVVIMENANIFTIPSTMNGYPRLDVDPKIATIFTNSSKTVLEKFIYEEEEETLTSNIGVKLNTNGTNTIAGNASDMESIIAIFFQYNNYLKYYSSGAYTQGEMIVLDSTPIASRVCLEGVDKFNYDGGSLPEGLY